MRGNIRKRENLALAGHRLKIGIGYFFGVGVW
jgi:hypothetical protein